jgi:polysaccharide pyruvyl transferase WcaK-like protein
MPTVLIYGWYHQGNVGDDLFMQAFKKIFPPYFEFIFVNNIKISDLQKSLFVFFGGGSFLNQAPLVQKEAWVLLKKKKIFYIGVGGETAIHPQHEELIKLSKLIVTRTNDYVDKLKELNSNVMFLPDLVFSLQNQIVLSKKIDKSILIMPNIATVPKYSDPHWKHAAWNYFKTEFAQFCDWLVENHYKINFFSMCRNSQLDDYGAAIEIINAMNKRNYNYHLIHEMNDIESVTKIISQYQFVITQRYHGIILSEMLNIPYLSIYHHDKLKTTYPNTYESISYYGLNKQVLFDKFNSYYNTKYAPILPIEANIFDSLQQQVLPLLEG